MTEEEERFKEQFITNFLACYAATNYDDSCLRGQHDKLAKNAPIEDAEYMAGVIWERFPKNDYNQRILE